MLRARWVRICILVAAVALLLLRFAHLAADYPAHVYFEDAIQTDEGWYASGPIDLHAWGTWLLPGDFNPAVALPVWPGIARLIFQLVGFGIVPLRATEVVVFCGCLALLWVLLRRYDAADWGPLMVLLLAANPYGYVFSRAAFLDVPSLFFVLLAVVLVSAPAEAGFTTAQCVRVLAAGVALACAVITKSTAFVFLPLLILVVFQASARRVRTAAFTCGLLFSACLLVCGVYWFAYARLHAADWHFLFAQNQSNLRLSPRYLVADLTRPIRWGFQSDRLLFPLCLVVLAASALVRRLRVLWRDPLYVFAAIWIVSTIGYMSLRNYAPPRYYVTLVPALVLMAVALLRAAEGYSPNIEKKQIPFGNDNKQSLVLALLFLDFAFNVAQTLSFIAKQSYSFRDATAAMQAMIASDPDSNSVVLSQSSHELALYANVRPVSLLWHTAQINVELERYQPDWWVQESRNDDGACFTHYLSKSYSARSMGQWTIFGNQQMTLWRLHRLSDAPLPVPTADEAAACRPPDTLAGTR